MKNAAILIIFVLVFKKIIFEMKKDIWSQIMYIIGII